MSDIPNPDNSFQSEHAKILLRSFRRWTGRDLLTPGPTSTDTARKLFTAPFVVVSHGTEDDPVFNYGNAMALKLFELGWEEFTSMPSRKSAEAVNRSQRAEILKQVTEKGYCAGYAGIRISASGRRFKIKDAILWNLLDSNGQYCGQAACFDQWEFL